MPLRARQKIGKYRIEGRLGEGGFATVYRAFDTIEGVKVALKMPHEKLITDEVLSDFRHEARMVAQLEHPNILPLKNAALIDGRFVIAYPLGERTLADRIQKRMSLPRTLAMAEQMIEAVAYAHQKRIIHCDIKPENFVLFADGRLRLTDFGIAKVAARTLRASGSGTVGYVAPEQAMGKPSFKSDVFSLGLILYRMLTGKLPEWPYAWPPPGHERLRKLHADLVDVVRRAIDPNPRRRYRDAGLMLAAFRKSKPRALRRHAQLAARSRQNSRDTSARRSTRRR